jgi:hypothetical protein
LGRIAEVLCLQQEAKNEGARERSGDRVIARDRLIGKTGISSRRRGDAEKIGKEQNLTTDEHRFGDLKTAKAITTEDNGGLWLGCMKPVLRQKTTIYRYFLTMDGMVQCLRLSTMKM